MKIKFSIIYVASVGLNYAKVRGGSSGSEKMSTGVRNTLMQIEVDILNLLF